MNETTAEQLTARPISDDDAWAAIKRRRQVGQVVRAIVTQIAPYGVFADIGERFPAFVDRVELAGAELTVGGHCTLKILQFADRNRQIRTAIATQREAFLSAMLPIDRAEAAKLEGELLKVRDRYRFCSPEQRRQFRHAVLLAAKSDESLGMAGMGPFRCHVDFCDEVYNDEGDVLASDAGGPYMPKILLQAIAAWDRGEEFVPSSLWQVIAAPLPAE